LIRYEKVSEKKSKIAVDGVPRPAPRCPLVFGRKLSFPAGALAASCLGFLVGEDDGLLGFVAGVVTPVGLHEHGVDLFEINGFGAVAHGFEERADTEVPDGPQDEVEGFVGEEVGVVDDGDWKRASFQNTNGA
jgi:hypothetical protein